MVIKTSAEIREFIHAGVLGNADDDEVARVRRAETAENALEKRLAAPHDPAAEITSLDAL